MNSKGSSVIFTSIMVILLSIAAMVVIIGFVAPYVTSLKEQINYKQNKENIFLINKELLDLKNYDINTYRNLNLNTSDEIVFDKDLDTIEIKQKISSNSFNNFKDTNYGNITIIKENGFLVYTLFLDGVVDLNKSLIVNNKSSLRLENINEINGIPTLSILQQPGLLYVTMVPRYSNFEESQVITLSANINDTNIYYTTNGTEPTSSSTPYNSPITITSTTTIKARAYAEHYSPSTIAIGTYTKLITGQAITPVADPVAGTYILSQNVSLSSDAGATIYYTTNGSTPTTSSSVYSSPISITTNTTLKAIATKSGLQQSEVFSGEYIIKGHLVPSITKPADDSEYTSADDITFIGSATNNYGDYNCFWNSNIDGNFGTECTINTSSLSIATHNITLSVTDGLETQTTAITIGVVPSVYRKSITFDKTKVDANLTNFPVLISLTDTNLHTFAQTDGSDIYFTDSDGVTKLKREIEDYNSTAGTLIAWVKIPAISSTVNTKIYMYFGDSDVNDPNDTAVWDVNYVLVNHLSSNLNESTSLNNKFVNTNATLTTGMINKGFDFNAALSSKMITSSSSSSYDVGSQDFTMSGWFYIPKAATQVNWGGIIIGIGYSTGIDLACGRVLSGTGAPLYVDFTASVTRDKWYYLTLTHVVAQKKGTVYFNGAYKAEDTYPAALPGTNKYVYLAADQIYMTGKLDEIRISNMARSASWIKTEYNNQNSPGTFFSVGSLEPI